jgi:hypothetical protein
MTKDRPDLSPERVDQALLRWRGPAAAVNYRPVLSSERALQNNWPQVPDGGLTPRLTGRLTVGRNVTSTSTSNTGIVGWNPIRGMGIFVCSVFVFSCIGSGLAAGSSPVQELLPSVCMYRINKQKRQRPTKGCKAITVINWY